jgi:hypothetical protein
VIPEGGVQRVVVVGYGVGRVELVAVLAVDDLIGDGLEAGWWGELYRI